MAPYPATFDFEAVLAMWGPELKQKVLLGTGPLNRLVQLGLIQAESNGRYSIASSHAKFAQGKLR